MCEQNDFFYAYCSQSIGGDNLMTGIATIVLPVQSIALATFGDGNFRYIDISSIDREHKTIVDPSLIDNQDAGTHHSPKYVVDGYPLVTSRNLSKGFVDLSDVNLICEADYQEVNRRSKVDKGDIIMPIIMPMVKTVGKSVLVDHDPEYAIKNVALIKFHKGSPSNVYIQNLLSGLYFDQVLSQNNRGGTQKFVSLRDIRSFPIPVPPPTLQKSFATISERIKQVRIRCQITSEACDKLFASIQHRAFKGELFKENL